MEIKKAIDIRGALVFIKNLWLKNIKDHIFKVNVANQIKLPDVQNVNILNQKEIQKVEITNEDKIQRVEIVNETSLDELVSVIKNVLKEQIDKISELKDNSDLIDKLDALKPIDSSKGFEDTVSELKSVVTAIKNQKLTIDTSKIEKGLKTLENGIKNIKLEESFKPGDLERIIQSIYVPTAPKVVGISNSNGDRISPATEDTLQNLVGLEIPPHDYIALSYTGSNLTGVVYKDGGVSGTTVATLTLGYDGSNNLTSVAKT